MDNTLWRITIDLKEINNNATTSGELYDHLMKWLSNAKKNKQLDKFHLKLENIHPKNRD